LGICNWCAYLRDLFKTKSRRTSHQSPITNHQSLVTNHQSLVTIHQSTTTTDTRAKITNSLSTKAYNHQPILTYFKIGFWDGLSPNSRRGAFLLLHSTFYILHFTFYILHFTLTNAPSFLRAVFRILIAVIISKSYLFTRYLFS